MPTYCYTFNSPKSSLVIIIFLTGFRSLTCVVVKIVSRNWRSEKAKRKISVLKLFSWFEKGKIFEKNWG